MDSIKCPVCSYKFDWEAAAAHITYWGEDGPKEAQCEHCEADLRVDETVVRTYEVTVNDQ